MSTVIPRPTARILLLNPDDQLLLFHVFGDTMPFIWITPGGGREGTETLEETALRELWEETGQRDEIALGPQVWYREHTWSDGERLVRSQEHFFLARTRSLQITIHDQREAQSILGWQWWSLNDLQQSDQTFAPRRLPALLLALLDGPLPTTPIDVGI